MNPSNPPKITPELLEANPQLAVALWAMSLLVMFVIVGSLASWTYLIVRARRGIPLLPAEASTPSVWGLVDIFVVAVLVVASQTLFASAYVRLAGLDLANVDQDALPAGVGAAASFGNWFAIALTLLWLALRFQVSPSQVGFRASGWMRQLQIAGLATLATLPIVYLMMAAVSVGLSTEYKHPLLEEIRAQATLPSYLLGALTAVILAPLAEEFLFRVMIQGWLQSWPVSSTSAILLGASLPERAEQLSSGEPLAPAEETAGVPLPADIGDKSAASLLAPSNPYNPPIAEENSLARTQVPFTYYPPVWPSVVTGILFGLAHWGYGLSFIPLIVLGVVLGLIYRATNSIWPCFLVHMALNGSSMLGLGLSILIERA